MINERVAVLEALVSGMDKRLEETLGRLDRLEKRLWILGLLVVAGANALEFYGLVS